MIHVRKVSDPPWLNYVNNRKNARKMHLSKSGLIPSVFVFKIGNIGILLQRSGSVTLDG